MMHICKIWEMERVKISLNGYHEKGIMNATLIRIQKIHGIFVKKPDIASLLVNLY